MQSKFKNILNLVLVGASVVLPSTLMAQSNRDFPDCGSCDSFVRAEVKGLLPIQEAVNNAVDLDADGKLTICIGDTTGVSKRFRTVWIKRDNVHMCGASPWAVIKNETTSGVADEQSGIIIENAKNFSMTSIVVTTAGQYGNGLTLRNSSVDKLTRIGIYPYGQSSNGIVMEGSKINSIDTSQLYLDTNGLGHVKSNTFGAGILAKKGSHIDAIIRTRFSFSNATNKAISLDESSIGLLQEMETLNLALDGIAKGGYGIYMSNNSRIAHIKGGSLGVSPDRDDVRIAGRVSSFNYGLLLNRSKIGIIENLNLGTGYSALFLNESEIHRLSNVAIQTGKLNAYGAILYNSKIGSISDFRFGRHLVKAATTSGDQALYLYNSQVGLVNNFDLRANSGANSIISLYNGSIDQLSSGQLVSPTEKYINLLGTGNINHKWNVTQLASLPQ